MVVFDTDDMKLHKERRLGIFRPFFPLAPEAHDAKGLLLQSLFPADASDLSQTAILNLHLDLRLAPLPPDTDEFNGFCTH